MKKLIPLLILGMMLLNACSTNRSSEAAGKINGTPISLEQFYGSQRRNYADFSYRYGKNPDTTERRKIFNDTWRSLTQYTILKDYFEKYDIKVSDQEAIDTLSASIPAFIINSPRFQVDGAFNRNLYLQSLLTDRPENQGPLREDYRERVIPIQKLKDVLIDEELLDKSTQKQIAKILRSDADIDLYIFDPEAYPVSVSEADVAAYYQKNIEKYRLRPFHRLAYCAIPVSPEPDDFSITLAVADSLYRELAYGTAAEDAIRMYQNSGAVLSIVDSGYQSTSDLPAELKEAFAALSDGQCTKPLKTEQGYVIHQKVQSTRTMSLYRSIYLQAMPRSVSLVQPEATARNLMNLALQIGLEQAAHEFDLSYHLGASTPLDSLDLPVGDMKGSVLKKLRSAAPGSIFEPIFSQQAVAWLVMEVVDNQINEYKPLEAVAAGIKTELHSYHKREANLLRARQWVATQAKNNYHTPADHKLEQVTTESMWEGKPLGRLYYAALNAHLDKSDPPVIELDSLAIVPVVRSVRDHEGKISYPEIRAAFAASLAPDWFETWLQKKLKNARVDIWVSP